MKGVFAFILITHMMAYCHCGGLNNKFVGHNKMPSQSSSQHDDLLVMGDYTTSICKPGTDTHSWTNGVDEPQWENFHRYRSDEEENKMKECLSPYTGKLSTIKLESQRRMFQVQSEFRHDFEQIIANMSAASTSKKQTIFHHTADSRFVSFNGHPRIPRKQSQCDSLGLSHQLMNFHCELNLAIYLNRTLLTYPLVEDKKFSKCEQTLKPFISEILNIESFPVIERDHVPLANQSFMITLDPSSLQKPKESLEKLEHINLVRNPKERQSSNCVEYSWCSCLPTWHYFQWSIRVQSSALKQLFSPVVEQVAYSEQIEGIEQRKEKADQNSLGFLIRKHKGIYDAVHVRGGDKLGALDVTVGVPKLEPSDITSRIRAHLLSETIHNARHFHKHGLKEKDKTLLIIATDTIELIDKQSLSKHFDVYILTSSTDMSPDEERVGSQKCASFHDLAVEMFILEGSRRLITSDHSNIGRLVTLNRINKLKYQKETLKSLQESTAPIFSITSEEDAKILRNIESMDHQNLEKGDNSASDGHEVYHHNLFLIRYLYSLDTRHLLAGNTNVGEWELAVKRNDEDSVALLIDKDSKTVRKFYESLRDHQ